MFIILLFLNVTLHVYCDVELQYYNIFQTCNANVFCYNRKSIQCSLYIVNVCHKLMFYTL